MERRLVKNFNNFFLIRYFSIIALCFLTLFITGRLGDIDFLLGYIEYGAGGTTSSLAKNIFSKLGFIGNRYIIICLIAALCTLIIWILLKRFIDNQNANLWVLTLMAPGLLIYTNSVTKETLFLYPAIIYIILESFYLTDNFSKPFNTYLNFIVRISLLSLMILIRGDLSSPYIILFLLSIFFRNIYLGNIINKLRFNSLIINSFFISIISTFIFIFLREDYFIRTIEYLQSSFTYANYFRPTINVEFIRSPLNYFYIQYLSLFPTPLELIYKPYKISIIIDSLILLYCFSRAWKSLFKIVNPYKSTRQIIALLFTFITIIYFSLFGILGSFNLGSSQRLRTNYIPIGIIFPLVLEKVIRDKNHSSKIIYK